MKYKLLLVFFFLSTGLFAQSDTAAVKDKSLRIVSLFKEGRYTEIEAVLAPSMKQSINAQKLQQVWEAVGQKLGSLKTYQGDCLTASEQGTVYFVKCEFENSPIVIKLIYDKDLLLQGFYFVNASECS